MPCLYVGIAPARPAPPDARLRRHLRVRLRTHYRSNADASTLRLTLGSLLAERLGLQLELTPSGRFVFGREGEARLSEWMAAHAFVAWAVDSDPWVTEDSLLEQYDLPLNLQGNRRHSNWQALTEARARARAQALRRQQ
jgi:hypothetical protein